MGFCVTLTLSVHSFWNQGIFHEALLSINVFLCLGNGTLLYHLYQRNNYIEIHNFYVKN